MTSFVLGFPIYIIFLVDVHAKNKTKMSAKNIFLCLTFFVDCNLKFLNSSQSIERKIVEHGGKIATRWCSQITHVIFMSMEILNF